MRKNISIGCLLVAWFCANSTVWNAVQVVAWAQMFHEYTQTMSPVDALRHTFDGTAPCPLCHVAETGQDATRDRQSQDTAFGGSDRILLACEKPADVFLCQPDFSWPGVADARGSTRTEVVPVPPPRV